MQGQGICLKERALVVFPDGSRRSAQIWQHVEGIRAIYAIAPDDEGIPTPFALEPVWMVRADGEGNPYWQGMASTHWLIEFWAGLKILVRKGRTRISRLNLA
jgi:hypothetical protein